jgi:hypothetical protein
MTKMLKAIARWFDARAKEDDFKDLLLADLGLER